MEKALYNCTTLLYFTLTISFPYYTVFQFLIILLYLMTLRCTILHFIILCYILCYIILVEMAKLDFSFRIK